MQSALSYSQVSVLEAQSQIQTQTEELTTLQQLKDQVDTAIFPLSVHLLLKL